MSDRPIVPASTVPITAEPKRVRPPYDVADASLDHLMTSDLVVWRRARQLDRLTALREPLAGLEVSEYEHGRLEYLAEVLELHVVAVLVSLLHRARAAASLADAADVSEGSAVSTHRPRRRGIAGFGVCGVCGRMVSLRQNLRLRAHNTTPTAAGQRCEGSGGVPIIDNETGAAR